MRAGVIGGVWPSRAAGWWRRRKLPSWVLLAMMGGFIMAHPGGTRVLAQGPPGADSSGEVSRAEEDVSVFEVQERELALDVAFGTHLPISVGGELTLHLPMRLMVAVHLGWMPGAYVNIINGIAMKAGAYNETVAGLVSAAADNSLVFRASVGARPFANSGFELSAGYTQISAGGAVAATSAIEEATGISLAGYEANGTVATQLHAFHVALGWRWVIRERAVVQLALGWLHTLRARTQMESESRLPGGASTQEHMDRALRDAENHLDRQVLERWGFSPELRITTGFRF